MKKEICAGVAARIVPRGSQYRPKYTRGRRLVSAFLTGIRDHIRDHVVVRSNCTDDEFCAFPTVGDLPLQASNRATNMANLDTSRRNHQLTIREQMPPRTAID